MTARDCIGKLTWRLPTIRPYTIDTSSLFKKLGFVVTHHRVQFYGICTECLGLVNLSGREMDNP